jgi:hypothetical protein
MKSNSVGDFKFCRRLQGRSVGVMRNVRRRLVHRRPVDILKKNYEMKTKTQRQKDKKTKRQKDKQTKRQKDKMTKRQNDKKTKRQKDKKTK